MTTLPITWNTFAPMANHLWQSTVVALLCGLLALLFRRHRAHVRHWLWLLASVKFLVPFAGLIAIGRELAVPFAGVAMPMRAAAPAADAIVEPFSSAAAVAPVFVSPLGPSSPVFDRVPSLLLAVWAFGAFVLVAAWATRWIRLRAVAAVAVPSTGGRELSLLRELEARAQRSRAVELRLTASSMEPGVFGILRPVLLWPAGISARLDDSQIEAVLAHELSHLRRHDNLKAALHMIVQAVFWFYPVVWWLGRQLVAERERACDEAVIQLGSDPETYAESILTTCAYHIESPLVCVAGVTGADLKRRIEQIMDHRVIGLLSLPGKVLLTCAALVVIIVPVFAGTLQGRPDRPRPLAAMAPIAIRGPELHEVVWLRRLHSAMQSLHDAAFAAQGKPTGGAPAAPAGDLNFEVASVKPNKSADGAMQIGIQLSRFVAQNMPLRQLIVFAYGVQPYQVEGGPSWMATERFDINAKVPDGTPTGTPLAGEPGPVNFMLRALLAERFKLVVDRATKEAPVYELRLARADGKLGPNLKPSTADCAAMFAAARQGGAPPPPMPQEPGKAPPCGLMMGPGNMAGGDASMLQLTRALGNRVGRPVIDKTGLTGNYEFTISFQPDFGGLRGGGPPTPPPGGPTPAPIDPDAPTIYTAIQEQLGLKLVDTRGPVETIVVKSVEMPTPD